MEECNDRAFLRAAGFCLVLLTVSAAVGEGGKEMSVQVKQGQVRATPSNLGKILATLSYGDRVEILEDKDGWIRIVPPGKGPPGWDCIPSA